MSGTLRALVPAAVIACALLLACGGPSAPPAAEAPQETPPAVEPTAASPEAPEPPAPDPTKGIIAGHVSLNGPAPANPVIRMGADPVCAALARATGALPVQKIVVTDGQGGLANTFVSLDGSFEPTPVPTEAVTINQRTCVYEPRVVGAQAGQTLKIVNLDTTLHNLHSLSTKNPFNVTQPKSGMVFNYELKNPDEMLRLTCDVHSWMHGYIAVVAHPYFAVSGDDGAFTIANVPPGRYTIKFWHERFGEQTQSVTVTAGDTTTLDFTYDAAARPRTTAVREITVPTVL